MWAVWGGWVLWEWVGGLAGGTLRESPDVFVGVSCVSCGGVCASWFGISLIGASGTGPVVFWVVWFTVKGAGFATQGTGGWRIAFGPDGSFQGCIFVAKSKEFLVHGMEAPFHLIHGDGGRVLNGMINGGGGR